MFSLLKYKLVLFCLTDKVFPVHMFVQYLLSIYYVPDTVLDVGSTKIKCNPDSLSVYNVIRRHTKLVFSCCNQSIQRIP